jgi:pimeloyl-ACP methyl ester carboxylesterase
MSISPIRHRARLLLTALVVSLASVIATSLFFGGGASADPVPATAPTVANAAPAGRHHDSAKPTVVLVHGAFADASGWAGVITRLEDRGYPVIAPANPLRGVASDSAYIASVLATIPGPIILVGHSYGGEVITNAALGNPNVKALVYIAAFAPDNGETSGGLAAMFPGSELTPANLVFRPYRTSPTETGTDAYINPTVFHAVFCADLARRTATVMAASQRPASLATLGEASGEPAWKTIPSWYLVASQDKAIPPAAERFMAKRMGAHTIEIRSSHVAMISHPGVVTGLITDAARSTR